MYKSAKYRSEMQRFVWENPKRVIRGLILCVLPLVAGAILYLVFRDVVTMRFPILSAFTGLFGSSQIPHTPFLEALAYNVPDGLWAFSFVAAGLLLWQAKLFRTRVIIFGSILLLVISFEFLQSVVDATGTYDPLDILYMTVFGGAAFLLNNPVPQ
jgi:hypothetical protein